MTYTQKDHQVSCSSTASAKARKHLAEEVTPHHVVRIGYTAPAFPDPTDFDGLISEVRFYQRALNREQIATLAMKEPAGGPAVGRWRLDALQGGAIRDETGHGHEVCSTWIQRLDRRRRPTTRRPSPCA